MFYEWRLTSAAILQLISREDEALLVGGNALLVLHLGLHGVEVSEDSLSDSVCLSVTSIRIFLLQVCQLQRESRKKVRENDVALLRPLLHFVMRALLPAAAAAHRVTLLQLQHAWPALVRAG